MEIFSIERGTKVDQQLEEYSQNVVFSLFGLVREREKVGHREGDTWKGILQAVGA